MKKFIIISLSVLIFSPATVLAEPWGHMTDAVRYPQNYLAHKFVNNADNKISFCTAAVETPEEDSAHYTISQDDLKDQFIVAFTEWTKGVASMIESHPRAKEFEEITKVLKKPVELDYMGQCDQKDIYVEDILFAKKKKRPDIALIYSQEYCSNIKSDANFKLIKETGVARICMKRIEVNTSKPFDGNPYYANAVRDMLEGKIEKYPHPFVCPVQNPEEISPCRHSLHVIIHELGHAFGLRDEYQKAYSPSGKGTEYWDINSVMGTGLQLNWGDVEGMIVKIADAMGTKINIDPSLASDFGSKIINNKYVASEKEKKAAKEINKAIKKNPYVEFEKFLNVEEFKKKHSSLLEF